MLYRIYLSTGFEFILLYAFLAIVLLILFEIKPRFFRWLYIAAGTISFAVLYNLPNFFAQLIYRTRISGLILRPYQFACTILLSVLFSHFMLQGEFTVKLFYILLFENVIQEFKVLCSPIYDQFYTMDSGIYQLLDIGSTLALFGILLLLSLLFRKFKIRNTPQKLPKSIGLIFYFPVSFLMTYMIYSYSYTQNINFVPIISAVIITNIPVIYFFFFNIIHALEDQQQLSAALQQSNAKLAKYQFSLENQERTRKERHELQNHYFYIRALLEEKDYKKLEEFLNHEIGSNIEELFEISSGNTLMDHILNLKMQEAHKHNIKTYTEILIPENLPIVDEGFCSILLNLMENAIEASTSEPDADIHIIMKCSGNYLTLKIANKISRDVLRSNPELKSTKPDASEHGIGIPIIRETVHKKDGMTNFEMIDGYFTATVMLPLA